MKLDTDNSGNLVICPTGQDTPIEHGIPQGIILVMRSGEIVEVFEQAGKIVRKDCKAETHPEFP